MNILVVEDNQLTKDNLAAVLNTIEGVSHVYKASNGKEAIKIFESNKIDLFYLDIHLPDINGIRIAEKIRSISAYELTYIGFLTTYSYYQLKCFKKIHCYDFLEKPYTKSQILSITEKLIKGTRNNKVSEQEKVIFQLKNCI